MAIKCPKCHFENPEDTFYCGKCATPLPSSKDISVSQTETLQTPFKELTMGSTFAGRYQIIEELGKGGMGKVYRVLDKKLKEEVALKLIKPEVASDKETIERFSNELKLARRIGHRNVGRMFELMQDEGTHFITMEYVTGEDLKSFIRRSRQLTVGTATAIAKQVCEGLAEAHRLGVVHRDLKPSNIMIDKEGNARIMDFGIARSLKGKGITGAGVMIGTPEYMSPEQVEGKEADQRSDIYSLGVILYEMVTGRVPFEGDTPLAIAVKQKTEAPRDPKLVNAQIPEDLSRVVLKCLEKEKEKRYQTAGEVRPELENIEKGIPSTERIVPERKSRTSREITVTFGLKKLLVPGLVIAALIISAIIIIWRVIPRQRAAPAKLGIYSIAVLPFADISLQKDQDYFCDGMTDEIIARLSTLQGWKVMNRTSVLRYKNADKSLKEIGQELDVNTILEGSVRKEENDIRVTARLINVDDNAQLWSEIYDQKLEGVFAIQGDIAQKITEALKAKLSPEEEQRLQKKPTENLAAYNLYLQGRFFWNKRAPEEMKRASDYFTKAIEKAPNFALAYTGLADCYIAGGGSYFGLSAKEAFSRARKAVMKALEIDETLAEAHNSLAGLKQDWEWDWAGAEREFRRAIELKPSYATAFQWYAELLSAMARHEEAIIQAKRALELAPFSIVENAALGAYLYLAGRNDEAIKQLRYTLELDPDFLRAHYWLGFADVQRAKFAEAIADFQNAIRISGSDPQYLAALGYAYAAAGRRDEAEKVFVQLKPLSDRRYVSPLDIAMIYAGLNEKEQAIVWITKAYEERSARMQFLKVDPVFSSLRPDPYFQDLLRGMGFPETKNQK